MPAMVLASPPLPARFLPSQKRLGDMGNHNHHLKPPLPAEAVVFAACPAPSPPHTGFRKRRRMLGGCPSRRSSQGAGTERDDRPHTGDSPGPFQASISCGFSPGSGFSSSFGLSGASLDSAAGEGRQQVTGGEFQRQHSVGVGTTGPAAPRGQDAHRFTLEDAHVRWGFPLKIPVSNPHPIAQSWGPLHPMGRPLRTAKPTRAPGISQDSPGWAPTSHLPPRKNLHVSPIPLWAPRHPVQPHSRHGSICGVFIAT